MPMLMRVMVLRSCVALRGGIVDHLGDQEQVA